jgi:peptide/nickel transport system permease protein
MSGSTRGSATSDTTPAAIERRSPGARRRIAVRRIVHTPAGLVGIALTVLLTALAVLADVIAPTDPFASVAPAFAPPSPAHLLGTDDLGRDVLSGVAHGARTSLLVSLAVTALAASIGVVLGAVAGYHPGGADDVLMRGTDAVQVIPRFFLAVLVVAVFGPGLDRVVLVLGLTSWPAIARVVRAETLSLARREFVDAAHALGASTPRILVRHVLPNALPTVLVVISLNAASVILLEAALGFIGLGDPRAMSLGYLANNAQRFLRVAWWLAVFPGAAIALAILGLNLLGDALADSTRRRRGGTVLA